MCIGITSCSDDKNITTYTTKKTAYFVSPTWQKPNTWQLAPLTHISQLAVFKVGNAKASISMLNGNGGGILLNVNRWRRQLQLPPLNKQQLDNEIRKIGNWTLIKLTDKNKENAIFGAIQQNNQYTIFAKLSGSVNTLNIQAETFLQFITSINTKVK